MEVWLSPSLTLTFSCTHVSPLQNLKSHEIFLQNFPCNILYYFIPSVSLFIGAKASATVLL